MTIAAFLDRDGTLNQEIGYIREVEKLELLPGAAQAVKKLNEAGVLAILTTNQSGVARGFYDEAHIHALHDRLAKLLWEEAGAKLDAIFYCPHHPRGAVEEYRQACSCRKPEIGMIQEAQKRFGEIVLSESFVLGDKATDVDLAVNAGCQGILLQTGYGRRVLEGKYQELRNRPDFICEDVLQAVETVILAGLPV